MQYFYNNSTPPPKPQQISLEDDVNNLVDESMNIVNKAMDVNTRSNVMKKNATKTKEDALDIEEKLRKLLRSIQSKSLRQCSLRAKYIQHFLLERKCL